MTDGDESKVTIMVTFLSEYIGSAREIGVDAGSQIQRTHAVPGADGRLVSKLLLDSMIPRDST